MNIDKVLLELKKYNNVSHIDYYYNEINKQKCFGRLVITLLEQIEKNEIGESPKEIIQHIEDSLSKIDKSKWNSIDYKNTDNMILFMNNSKTMPIGRMFTNLFKQAKEGKFKLSG